MKPTNIKISIIIPVYNVEKYISKCISSVISQTYKNIEIILVDDGSTDKSGLICDSYSQKDNRIKVIHVTNGGVSKARNIGIASSSGEYICFVDGDDFVMDDYVEYMFSIAISHSSDIVICTKMFSNFDNKQVVKDNICKVSGEEAVIRILTYKIPIGVYSKLFKTELIKNKKIDFLENIFIGEGFNFNVTCFQQTNNITISDHKIYFYRRDNNNSATTKFSIKKCENSLLAMQVMNEKLIIRTPKVISAFDYATWRTYTDAYDYISLGKGKKENKDTYKMYKNYIKKNYKVYKRVNLTKKEKLRAIVMRHFPSIIPLMLKIRRKKYKIKIKEGK